VFKICPRCGDEFVPKIEECPDCRVALRTAEELASAPPAPSGSASGDGFAGAAPVDASVMLRRGAASDLRELSERLAARGVRFAVNTDPPGGRIAPPARRGDASREVQLAIYVAEADVAEAQRVAQEWVLETVPGAADAHAAGAIEGCPGCGEPLAADAVACASCGLEFPPLEVACPACGRGVAPESESCPGCGYRP
jgi:hypothetical protein